ncbi:MAG: hypothetical protein ACLPLR_16395 [Terriglobales bacterium]
MNMNPTVTILVGVLAAGLASAQSHPTIQSTHSTATTVNNHAPAAPKKPATTPQPARTAPATTRLAVKPAPPVAKPAVEKHRFNDRRMGGVVVLAPAAAPAPQDAAPEASGPAEANLAGNGSDLNAANDQSVVPDTKYSANGRRDPFLSPVVSHEGGSGCTTGKKCLEIGAINLRGVVRTESGFIAVVSNNMNKAYFLRENDPVFNGYVVKITGDSIVFQETLQDRLGKSFTREVVKKITTPAV